MAETALVELAEVDGFGRPTFQLAAGANGDLVLCRAEQLGGDFRALAVDERVALAQRGTERPALVVESQAGEYVVLLDTALDPERYIPLGPEDVELLARTPARARFGRRDDDVLLLTPWADDDDIVIVDLDAPEFADLPVVTMEADGTMSWVRNRADDLLIAVHRELQRISAEPGRRFGVFSNDFGECLCLADGEPLLPHEDIRRQTLMGTEAMVEGAETLEEAAVLLRAIAERLSRAAQDGWELLQPISDGIAFVERRPVA